MNEGNTLYVYEYGGTGRSGKGTGVEDIATRHPGVATEETGADYRCVTFSLYQEGSITPDMPESVIVEKVAQVHNTDLTDIVADRRAIVEQHGLDVFYTPEVTDMVSLVSPLDSVRKAVKAGFTKRVIAVRDSEVETLLVDGRNLAPVVEAIPGVSLVMRTFLSCYPIEAAFRECARQGIDLGTEEGQGELSKIAASIEKRNKNDAARDNDPVVPDQDAIDYWYDPLVFEYTIKKYRQQHNLGYNDAVLEMFGKPGADYTDHPRSGVGLLAVLTGLQINFDTTSFRIYEDPKQAMLDTMNEMFEEAHGFIGDLKAA